MAIKISCETANKFKQSAKGITKNIFARLHENDLNFMHVTRARIIKSKSRNETPNNYSAYIKNQFKGYNFLSKAMATYYSQYNHQQIHNYPFMMTEWNPIVATVQAPNALFTSLVPIPFVLTPQIVAEICPYTGILVAEPLSTPMITNPVIPDTIPIVTNGYEHVPYSADQNVGIPVDNPIGQTYPVDEVPLNEVETEDLKHEDEYTDPLEFYLTLPKELFPTARMFSLDPNPIVDEFCKLVNLSDNISWILDLEFGIPKSPVTRAIPVYDVQFNSIHCKNTPGAIHPGFESCNADFKRAILFYYDCVISTWYKGFIVMNNDKSVKNFQSWLLRPMQIFGMCWP